MRLDLVLKQTAIIKRRTVAKTLAETGHVQINSRVAKPSSEVKEDDILSIRLGSRIIVVKIKFIHQNKREVPTYEVVSPDRN